MPSGPHGPRPAPHLPGADGPRPCRRPPLGSGWQPPGEVLAGAALVGTRVLYQWPTEGWVLGVVVRMSSAQGFSHVIRYGRGSALGPAVVASLLDAASHGPAGRWILLLSTAIR